MGDVKHVYQAINEVTAALAREGISKSRKNEQQNFKFRGIDDVYNAIAPIVATAKLCILPRVVERTVTERPTKSGGVSTYAVLTVEFDLVSAVDGSTHTIRTMGEAMDTADKATNKAMSAATKYACIIAFQIPTEGDNDADAHHIEPSLERQLAASVDMVEWKKLAHARLLSAEKMGDLAESWSKTLDEGKKMRAPDSVMRELSAVKDACKAKFAPANTNGTQA